MLYITCNQRPYFLRKQIVNATRPFIAVSTDRHLWIKFGKGSLEIVSRVLDLYRTKYNTSDSVILNEDQDLYVFKVMYSGLEYSGPDLYWLVKPIENIHITIEEHDKLIEKIQSVITIVDL